MNRNSIRRYRNGSTFSALTVLTVLSAFASCVDAGDYVEHKGGLAHAGQPAKLATSGSTDTSSGTEGTTTESLELGGVSIYWVETHEPGDVELLVEAVKPEDRQPYDMVLAPDGLSIRFEIPKGMTNRFVILSAIKGALKFEVETPFNEVAFMPNWEYENVVLVPLHEGQMPESEPMGGQQPQ